MPYGGWKSADIFENIDFLGKISVDLICLKTMLEHISRLSEPLEAIIRPFRLFPKQVPNQKKNSVFQVC